ncbi:Uncharacterised protein [Burkholderia pseudomallei]|uniref:hypothetical protein n=1 Tax=Burkholderia thailandensis TaxID=57975 RepID=UPI0004743D5D|nr:hypothetical protein [Burkholderia thailandensis]AIS96360.1 hypothetical protein BTHA_3272 [Burkholderia thailandensis MSMB59]KGS44701.1 hypothetical protein X992_833 [Burkholderia pseudomallei MSHR5492]CAJ9578864.1 Uncharacterised protein [Burkholderia pseudomallei]AOJ44357.1 hypothetical protein WJ27_04100 [Burkholderia thailandensis]KVG16838.1 hypothetical protein WJ28_12025 [Burkholderia thailandensis]
MFVQFSGADEKVIVAVFASVQDNKIFMNQGQVDLSDPRYASFFNELPPLAREALPLPTSE